VLGRCLRETDHSVSCGLPPLCGGAEWSCCCCCPVLHRTERVDEERDGAVLGGVCARVRGPRGGGEQKSGDPEAAERGHGGVSCVLCVNQYREWRRISIAHAAVDIRRCRSMKNGWAHRGGGGQGSLTARRGKRPRQRIVSVTVAGTSITGGGAGGEWRFGRKEGREVGDCGGGARGCAT